MISQADLRRLAEMNASERAFLSVYLANPGSVDTLERRFERLRRTLSGSGPERSERDHFDENAELVLKHLERNPLTSGGTCMFACWALDYFEAIPLTAPVSDHVCIDSSPFIRPLAELRDEYENVAVVVADNARARIYLVSSAVPGPSETVRGNVKNHVRKGGWSQQRYERRRDKQLLLYAREIAEALSHLSQESEFRRVLLVGGKEILGILYDNLPADLAQKVSGSEPFDLGRGAAALNEELWDLFFEEERRSEAELWERIRTEVLRGGLGAVGLSDVLEAAGEGRVDAAVVDRTYRPKGTRCRECDRLHAAAVSRCEECGSDSVFEVGVVNEICEQLARTGAQVDFVDPIPTLTEAGRIAALLRY